MLQLIERIRERLAQGAYINEAAISHGIVTPILNALGWDSADPDQMVPEFSIQRGRVDFALFALGHRPGVFIEVKGIGRAMDGDRQLFEYAFHQGVPLCVLTDGREWSFYVPGGQGSYEDRRVYRLQLDDRQPAECARILDRYLARARVRDGSAFEDAQRDYRDAAGRREATASLPRAWHALILEADDRLVETVIDKTEALCGFKPAETDVLTFLRGLRPAETPPPAGRRRTTTTPSTEISERASPPAPLPFAPSDATEPVGAKAVSFTFFGEQREFSTASRALVDLLGLLAARDPARLADLAQAVRGDSRSLIARTVAEINPARPDLARAAEFTPGWYVGLNISNREKMAIIRAACETFQVSMPEDLTVSLPNSDRSSAAIDGCGSAIGHAARRDSGPSAPVKEIRHRQVYDILQSKKPRASSDDLWGKRLWDGWPTGATAGGTRSGGPGGGGQEGRQASI